jgi:hypothetical protein
MSVYTNKRFVKQAAIQKKRALHDETWGQICSQVSEFETKEKKKQEPEEHTDDNTRAV